MGSKPRVYIFSIIPKLGETVKKLLPLENISIVNYPAAVNEKYGFVIPDEAIVKLKDADILLSDNNAFVQTADRLPSLKWFQGTWAGVEGIAANFRGKSLPPYRMTRMSSDTFCQLMAEYTVGQVIARERAWRQTDECQNSALWSHSGSIATYRSLNDLTVAVLGTGQIGLTICRALSHFHCKVLGYGRTPCDDTLVPSVMTQHYTGVAGLIEVLSISDYVVSVLPSTPHTAGLLTADLLTKAKPGCVLISIGRGDVISEETILGALDNGSLGGAVLDVFPKEPLPQSSPLWAHPKVTITPHCAGVSRVQDVAAVFVDNYAKYVAGQPLKLEIDLERGY